MCIDRIVVASGSAGTQAGLIAGLHGLNLSIPVVGITVSRDKAAQEQTVFELAGKTAQYMGSASPLGRDQVTCFDEYWRPGYAQPNAKMVEAVRLLARTEGIILDPVYTGKAMAGLIDLSRKKYFMKGENILFLHTGARSGIVYLCRCLFRIGPCLARERSRVRPATTDPASAEPRPTIGPCTFACAHNHSAVPQQFSVNFQEPFIEAFPAFLRSFWKPAQSNRVV